MGRDLRGSMCHVVTKLKALIAMILRKSTSFGESNKLDLEQHPTFEYLDHDHHYRLDVTQLQKNQLKLTFCGLRLTTCAIQGHYGH